MSDNFTPTITDEQAMQIIARGVARDTKVEGQRTLAYCKDAVDLRGFNIRKLSERLAGRAEDKGESFNSDSYQSNISNANGIMALFDWNLESFTEWLATSPSKSMSWIFKAFRQLFTEPKDKKPAKPGKSEGESTEETEAKALIDVVLSALPMLSPEERLQVKFMLDQLDAADHTPADVETPVAA